MYLKANIPSKIIKTALVLVLFSCSKHLYVDKTQPQHYAIKDDTAVDSSFVKMIQPYKTGLDAKMNEVIGTAPVALTKKTPESNLGNFFADAVYIKALTVPNVDTAHVIAVFNNGGLRTSVPQGNVTVGGMFELMPFENKLVILSVKGSRVLQMCNFIAEKDGAPIAGARFTISNKKAENILIHNQKLDTTIIYSIATSDYLAGGGDKFFTPGENSNMLNTNMLLRDILIDYCRNQKAQNKPVTAVLDGRISNTK